jgi:hypothetical protein
VSFRHRILPLAALALIIAAALPSGSFAAELLVFERRGCVWCQRFEQEIAPIYGKTEEGRQAPLRRVDIEGEGPPAGIALAAPVRFAPTFVLVDAGREIGRITGYISDEAFWGLLGGLTERLGQAS